MRKIPATMGTQHPDNASVPYWDKKGDGFVSAHDELDEAMSSYQDLGVEEYMWDWEGKHADEAVIDKIFTKYYTFCKKQNIGKDIFLTFRVPNVWHESGYGLARALMVILTSEDFSRDLKFPRPLFEIILPMTEHAGQLLYLQTAFRKLAHFKNKTFYHRTEKNIDQIEMIPLVESVAGQMEIGKLLREYSRLHEQCFKTKPEYLRPFLARSDPALVSGLLATVLANKIALSEIAQFAKLSGIKAFPIIGVGSLVFRGGLNPDSIKTFVKQYQGVRTVTIQSGFRYDYPLPIVKKATQSLNRLLPRTRAKRVSAKEIALLKKIIVESEKIYQTTLEKITPDMQPLFEAVPRRRERKLHVGLLSYGRSSGKTKLPRAINFTAAFYSLGIPPEFIGLGRALQQLSTAELELVTKHYSTMREEVARAGKFLHKMNLALLTKKNKAWRLVEEDVVACEGLLGLELGPETRAQKQHAALAGKLFTTRRKKKIATKLIVASGKLRKSLG